VDAAIALPQCLPSALCPALPFPSLLCLRTLLLPLDGLGILFGDSVSWTSEVTTRTFCRAVATTLGCGGGSYQTISYGAPYTAMPGYGYGTPFAAPVGYNAYQNPTVWNGDHVTSGGEPEWASEDAAQHALNLANWRIKLLQAKLQQAKLASKVMNVGTPLETHMAKTSAKVSSSDQAQLASLRKGLSSLAKQTTHAMSALAAKIDANKVHHKTRASHEKLRMLKRDTDRELSDIRKPSAQNSYTSTCPAPSTSPSFLFPCLPLFLFSSSPHLLLHLPSLFSHACLD
jgi:hypothetical protein